MKPQQLNPGQPAPDGVALDDQGQAVDLASLWPNGPTLLTFLRHFG